jgi:PAS domain S-box-containing protein
MTVGEHPAPSGGGGDESPMWRKACCRAITTHILDHLVVLEAIRSGAPGGGIVGWRCVDANEGAAGLLATTRELLIGRTVREMLGERAALAEERLRRVLETGVPERYETTYGDHTVLVTIFHVEGDTVASAAVDVTERKRAEGVLRESEERFRSLFENMTEGFAVGEVICDDAGQPRDFRMIEMNAAFEVQSGLRRAEIQGRPMTEILPRLERHWIESYGGVALSGEAIRFESYNRDLDRHFSVFCYSPTRGRFAIIFTDVTDQKRREEALRASTELLRAISDSSRDAIFAKDRDGRIRFANPTTLAVIGKPEERVLGRTDADLLEDKEAARQVMENDRRVMETGVATALEEHVPMPDGTSRIWLSRKVPYHDAAGNVVGLLGISHDITERKRYEEELREADRRKDEFLGMLSHELRNPLAPIRNSIYLLRNTDPGSAQAARAQSVIERQTEHLTRLVDDLLDVTRIARGKIELRRSRLDLREVVSRAAEDFRLLMRDRAVGFEVAVPDEKLWADADGTRITQVIGNLLHNASKFTRRGDEVRLSLEAAGSSAEIRVRDTGAGIEPALLPRVFDAFVQGERTLARTEGGLGLGLALVKGITELHGGTVRVHSAGKGKGAEFLVTLPLAPAAAGQEGSGAVARTDGGRRVLIVDDNADAAESLGDLVRMLGHTADIAYDGPSALEKATAAPPDLVLCDLGLPGMSGFEVARALRARGATELQLVALSGYAQPEDVRRALEAGFDEHLAKPAELAQLERLLAE